MILENFDFEVLNDPEFKEDAVREELVLPIIKALGYKLSGDSRVVRSRSLIHPFVAFGSNQKKVTIVPDYVFLSDGIPYWVLDAKAPSEKILKSKHVEQAYSYAIHPEIRAELFALCNGKEFVLFSVEKFKPILHFKIEEIDSNWEKLFRILNPEIKAHPESVEYHPDYGLHLHRLGATEGFQLILLAVNTKCVSRVEDSLYTAATVVVAENEYVASLDFDESQLKKLLAILPIDQAQVLEEGLKRQPYRVCLNDDQFNFGVSSKLTGKIIHNAEESYLPFRVDEFIEYVDFCGEKEHP